MKINTVLWLVPIASFCLVIFLVSGNFAQSRSDFITAGQRHGLPQDNFRWRGTIPAGRSIEIKGVFGTIHTEAASGTEVEVTAVKHALHSNPNEVRLQTLEHDGNITICALYPNGTSGRTNICEPGDIWHSDVHNNDVEVDFNVRIPPGVRLLARTINGDIEAVALRNNVDASTVIGNIRISTTDYAKAKTVHGDINASLGNADWNGPLEFQTILGAITLDLPAKLNTEFHAETISGEISTEFPLVIQGRMSHNTVNGTIGNGGRQLNLKTVTGAIRVRRSV